MCIFLNFFSLKTLTHKSQRIAHSLVTFLSLQSKNPWLKIKLAKHVFVAKVDITNTRTCCLNPDNSFKVFLDNSTAQYCTKYVNVYYRKSSVFVCNQALKTREVTVQLYGVNKILTVCEVRVTAFGKYRLQVLQHVHNCIFKRIETSACDIN